MSGMVRSIRRGMVRDRIQNMILNGKLTCPTCGCKLTRKNIISRLVRCPNCKWWGRMK